MSSDAFAEAVLCLMHVVGRAVMPPETLSKIVGTNRKLLKAYNSADGATPLTKIAKDWGLDQGNFSRTADRWVQLGAAFWMGRGKDKKLLHLYFLPENPRRKSG